MSANIAAAGAIGTSKWDLDTPVLCLDATALERNIRRMGDYFANCTAKLRPHTKTHKSPIIAWMQLRAGAIGVTCAKVGEAEVMAAAGIRDILIANQVMGALKIARLVGLAAYSDVITAVECAEHARELSEAAQARGVALRTIIEVDVGMGRCGVAPGGPALDLARQIEALPGLRFEGMMGYEGHAVMVTDVNERRRVAEEAMARLVETRHLIESHDIPVNIVSAGGTGTYDITGNYPGITEIEAGSYATMDTRYRQVGLDFEWALTIVARVISVHGDRAIIDAGLKTMTPEFGLPLVIRPEGWAMTGLSEEHGALERRGGGPLRRGDLVEIVPSHGCTTINLHDAYHVTRNDVLEAVWPIEGRGRVR
ncbi:MAG: DSD1 family PLP-dependent enzyme [Anaerolineae bacterium]|jgi:D-serine deaminase-like pyridoxal phosphate-dependent protein